MNWTTEPPSEPGWYWMKSKKIQPEVVNIMRFWDRLLSVGRAYNDEREPLSDFISCRRGVQWAGPIPEPEDA